MELLQLMYFCDAAKEQNFSKTARNFQVPASNISNSIKRLETELGCELFDHSSNKVILNERGKNFYDKIGSALTLIDDAKTEINEELDEFSGDLYIKCKSNRKLVTHVVKQYINKYPNVNIHLTFGEAEMKKTDLIISYEMNCEYKSRTLLLEEDVPIAFCKKHPLAEKPDLSVSDLKGEKFITGLSIETNRFCKEAGFIPNIVLEINDPAYVRDYIEMGFGIGFIPSYSWKGLFTDNIVLRSVGKTRKTYAYIPKNKYIKRITKEFLKALLKEAQKITNC